MWCKHKYNGHNVQFSPPAGLKSFKVWGEEQAEQMQVILHGLSTIRQTCIKCGKVTTHTVPGKVE